VPIRNWLTNHFGGNWIDVTRGLRRFGLPRTFLAGVAATWPTQAFIAGSWNSRLTDGEAPAQPSADGQVVTQTSSDARSERLQKHFRRNASDGSSRWRAGRPIPLHASARPSCLYEIHTGITLSLSASVASARMGHQS